MFNTLKIKNDEVIITQNPLVEKDSPGITQAIVTWYLAVCEWFGIEDCKVSQVWFFGFFGLSIFMMITTYVIAGVCYGF